MLYNHLSENAGRRIFACNYNQHIYTEHPDRVLHHHDLIYIREGDWRIVQDETEYAVTAGDVILLQGGHHHYGIAPCDSIVKTIFLEFAVCEEDALSEDPVNPDGYCFPVVVHCQNIPGIRNYLESAVASFWAQSAYSQRKTPYWLEMILCELSGAVERKDILTEQVMQTIKKTPGRFLSNQELAEMLHCSVRTLSSHFQKSTGESIHAWQLKLKCQMAEELMHREPQITLKEIAANYGFYDEYHFGKSYKKIMGHSPKHAR